MQIVSVHALHCMRTARIHQRFDAQQVAKITWPSSPGPAPFKDESVGGVLPALREFLHVDLPATTEFMFNSKQQLCAIKEISRGTAELLVSASLDRSCWSCRSKRS